MNRVCFQFCYYRYVHLYMTHYKYNNKKEMKKNKKKRRKRILCILLFIIIDTHMLQYYLRCVLLCVFFACTHAQNSKANESSCLKAKVYFILLIYKKSISNDTHRNINSLILIAVSTVFKTPALSCFNESRKSVASSSACVILQASEE